MTNIKKETQETLRLRSFRSVWFLHVSGWQRLEFGFAKCRADELLCFFLFESFFTQQKRLQHISGLSCHSVTLS